MDLAEVNGRVFVNNVSLGLYAEAVQRTGTATRSSGRCSTRCPTCSDPRAASSTCAGPGPGGHEHHAGAAVLVSNNRYRLGHAVGSGTRPRIDDGLLGITVVGAPPGAARAAVPAAPMARVVRADLRGRSDRPVPAGIDGEALVLDPPLLFRIRPRVLRVRVARKHPGASPSATAPEGMWDGVRELARIALGSGRES